MRRFVLPCLVALAVFASAGRVFAQATGQIAGNVFDQAGMPLKGVKIYAKSETDPTARTTYTNDEGGFRIIGLMPGDFTVTSSAKGLKSERKVIKVGIGAGAEEIFVMEVETGEIKEVVVTIKTPTINTTAAVIKEKFDEEFLDALPLESKTNVQAVVANQVAGAVGDQSSPQVRGGTSTQNAYQLEGFQVNDVNGGRGQQTTFATVAALEVSTGGYGAENANAAGAVVNAVSKSGSNRFEVELAGWHENSKLRFFLQDFDPKPFSMNSLLAVSLSGPIIKDRLWFFTTLEGRNDIYTREKDPLGIRTTPPIGSNNSFRSTGKVTLQMTTRNKLQAVYIFNRDQYKNIVGSLDYDREAERKTDNFDYFGGLIWESMLSDNMLFRSQLGAQSYLNDYAPESCRNDPDNCDHVSGLRQRAPYFLEWQNATYHIVRSSQTVEFKNTLEYFFDSKSAGNHQFKLTARFYGAQLENKESTPGDSIYVFNGVNPDSKRTLYVNDPSIEDGRYGWAISSASSRMLQFSLQDQFKLPKYRYLTLTPGVGVMSNRAFDGAGNNIISFTTATPHIQAAWDVSHDGRTVLRAGFNQYLDAGNLNVANSVGQNRVRKICGYNSITKQFDANCQIDGGVGSNTVGLSCGPDGYGPDGRRCDTKLGVPRTWEYTFGAEREVVEGVAIGSDFQYRSYRNPYENLETNRIWNPSGTGLDPTGSYSNGRPRAVYDLETPDSAKRRYIGVITSVKKREGKFKANFTYQWSQLQGNVVDGFDNNYLGGRNGGNPAQDLYQYGFLPGDSRHSIRSGATYQINAWLSTGVTYNYTSGTPLNLMFYNPIFLGYTDFRARRGYDPGRNLNDPNDDFEWRLPDRQDFNWQIRVNLKPITKFNAEFWADFLNLLALRTPTGIETQDGMFARLVTGHQAPMRIRLNFRFKY